MIRRDMNPSSHQLGLPPHYAPTGPCTLLPGAYRTCSLASVVMGGGREMSSIDDLHHVHVHVHVVM